MDKPLQTYETAQNRVTFDPNVCVHSGNCVRGLPGVFNVRARPWIDVEGATADQVEAQVAKCPSGALKFYRN